MIKAHYRILGVCLAAIASTLQAQTSYPMLMSLKPVAAQVGQTTEHEVSSRYSMHGAYQVLVSGKGVIGEIATEMKEVKPGEQPPNLTALKVKFTVANDAMPGVREFRVATPNGVSTVGQLVVGRDPVVYETPKNDTADAAQAIIVPATVCGAIERNEDVDYFKFSVEAGTALTFHVRSMRLQDKIHDLQQHADPIISLRNSSGTTLAQSDNHFAADPLLSHRFETAGEYLLEIRDVRFQGNRYWEYSIEISDRPFVTGVFPSGVKRGEQTPVQLIGYNLPEPPTATLDVPADAEMGPRELRFQLGDGLSDPVPVVVTNWTNVVESDSENDAPEQAQPIALPATISGRIEREADIDCYTFEAKQGERFSFEVIARRQWSSLDSVVRILNEKGRQLLEGDDSTRSRSSSSDSWLENWTAPADGKYTLEIRDLHLRGGGSFWYVIAATRAEPHFDLFLDTDKTELTPGTSGVIFVRAERKNGFAGDVELAVEGLPEGVTASCGSIPASVDRNPDGCIVLTATADAKMSVANLTVTGTAKLDGKNGQTTELTTVAVPQQETYMPGGGRSHWQVDSYTVSIGAACDIRAVKLSTHEVTLKPGESQKIDITIERAPGFNKNVTLDMLFRHLNSVYGDTLPPGVTIDNAASKTLLTGEQTAGHITLKADAKAAPIEKRQVSVMANVSINFVMKATYSSEPLFVTVRE